MDKVTDSDSVDAGSIPARSAMLEGNNMNSGRNSTFSYAKLFLLMVIPIYGFCFTALLAFSKDVDEELRCLAKGALIARIVFVAVLVCVVMLFISTLLPMLNDFIDWLLSNINIVELLGR